MDSSGVRRHIRSNVVGYMALFAALGGTAYAADGPNPGQNTVGSEDIIGNEVKSDDIGNGRIFNIDVADETLTGADVNEGSLGQVPSALVGGMGRMTTDGGCDPTGDTYVDCGFTSLTLPQTSKILVTASGIAGGAFGAVGDCRLVTNRGVLHFVESRYVALETFSLTGITQAHTSGAIDVGLECKQASAADVRFTNVIVTAVALSPD